MAAFQEVSMASWAICSSSGAGTSGEPIVIGVGGLRGGDPGGVVTAVSAVSVASWLVTSGLPSGDVELTPVSVVVHSVGVTTTVGWFSPSTDVSSGIS